MKFLLALSFLLAGTVHAAPNHELIKCFLKPPGTPPRILLYVFEVFENENITFPRLGYPFTKDIFGVRETDEPNNENRECIATIDSPTELGLLFCPGEGKAIRRTVPVKVTNIRGEVSQTVYCQRGIKTWVFRHPIN